MINLYHSNSLEALFTALQTQISTPLPHPFAPEIIVVQSQGMARWLSYHIAQTQSIAANIQYPFPASFIWRVYQQTLPDIPDSSGYEKSALIWQVVSLLPNYLAHPAFISLARYLAEDHSQRKLFQLACRIGDLFDQYLVYRPQWMLDWAKTQHDHWQAILWKAIADNNPAGNRAQLLQAFLQAAQAGRLRTDALPKRIAVFGISALPPMLLAALAQLSELIDVHIYHFNPCLVYWGDIQSQRDLSRLRQKHGNRDTLNYYTIGNPLLASLGKLGQDHLELLHQYPCKDYELFAEPQAPGLLGALQADILLLINRSKPVTHTTTDTDPTAPLDEPKTAIRETDRSVQIHICHSKVREVEVLHDQLLNLFEQHRTLQPKDIVVMAPSIEDYAPFIEAIFNAAPQARAIPYSIADRSAYAQHTLIQAFFRLLELPQSRFQIDDVIELLEVPGVQRRFDLNTAALQRIRQWIRQSGVRWGLDANNMTDFDLPPTHQNTWAFGLERLFLGYAMPPEAALFDGIAPFSSIEGQEAEHLGKLQEYIHQLNHFKQLLAKEYSAEQWVTVINTLLEAFFGTEDAQDFILNPIRDGLAQLTQHTQLAHYDAPLSLDVLKDYLKLLLTQPISDQRFLTGQVTFCSLAPMRSIPFQVICLLGLNDQDFPRTHRLLDFDLMAKNPEKGDRVRREDDRYLFLEALLSARTCFYLSYVGRHIRDNSMLLPSVVLQELLDSIEAGFSGEKIAIQQQITTAHPLQPFSPKYFSEPDLFSYADEWVIGAAAVAEDKTTTISFGQQALDPPELSFKTIDLDNLIRFFKNPLRFFTNYRLNIWLDEDERNHDTTEPFSLTVLENHHLSQALLAQAVAGNNLDHYFAKIKAQGMLPAGHFSDLLYQRIKHPIERFSRPIKQQLDNQLEPEDVRLQWGEIKLQGRLAPVTQEGLVRYRFADVTAEDKLTLWLQHLTLNIVRGAHRQTQSTHYGKDKKVTFATVPHAEQTLKNLITIYWKGLQQPIAFFPKTSQTYAQNKLKSSTDAWTKRNVEQTWHGSFNLRGEKNATYYQTFYRDNEPTFDALFEKIARHVYTPIEQFGMEQSTQFADE